MHQNIDILLIEDSPEDSALMKNMLMRVKDSVFKLETKERLATGLEFLKHKKVDLVLLDLSLPDSFGIETFMGLHNSYPQIPVILLTGHDDKETALKLVREGAQDYIVKGEVDSNLLWRSILYAIERKKTEREIQKNYDTQSVINFILKLALENIPLVSVFEQSIDYILSLSWISSEQKAMIILFDENESLLSIKVARGHSSQFVDDLVSELSFEKCNCKMVGNLTDDYAGCPYEHIFNEQDGYYCIPLYYADRVIGLINISLENGHFRDPVEVDFLNSIANTLAGIIIRKKTEILNKKHLERTESLRTIELSITGNMDLNLVLDVFLKELITQLGIDAADILLLSHHTNNLKWFIGQGFCSDALQYTELTIGEGYAGVAALERRLVKVQCLPENLHSLKNSRHLHEEGFRTYFGVPLIAKGEVKGVLEVFHKETLNPDREWLKFLDSLATHAAIAIDNATLFSNLQQSNTELTVAYDTSIEGWARALDLRDRETEGHSRRVTGMTLDMAEALGISDTDTVHVRRGALLHDIGKMGIPDSILLKPGPLTKEEWKIMKCHPQYAHELLSPIKYLVPAVDIPYCHHEKWDGAGYPRGLKGTNIPLAARLFSIVDVWDALSSDRPYRNAWDITKVLEHIQSLSEKDFEPDLVKLFFQCLSKSGENT